MLMDTRCCEICVRMRRSANGGEEETEVAHGICSRRRSREDAGYFTDPCNLLQTCGLLHVTVNRCFALVYENTGYPRLDG